MEKRLWSIIKIEKISRRQPHNGIGGGGDDDTFAPPL
jgi:hypothetical protein